MLRFMSAVAACALAGAGSAHAALITYTATGNGAWLVNGTRYSGNFTLTGVGQNGPDFNPDPNRTEFWLDRVTMQFGNTILTSLDPMSAYYNASQMLFAFNQYRTPSNVGGIVYLQSPALAGYDLATAHSLIATNFYGSSVDFDTNGGVVGFQNYYLTTTFQATVASAVPEPASWALLIVGFGVIGAAIRRKPNVTVRFSNA